MKVATLALSNQFEDLQAPCQAGNHPGFIVLWGIPADFLHPFLSPEAR
jgi:hypothetical protein